MASIEYEEMSECGFCGEYHTKSEGCVDPEQREECYEDEEDYDPWGPENYARYGPDFVEWENEDEDEDTDEDSF